MLNLRFMTAGIGEGILIAAATPQFDSWTFTMESLSNPLLLFLYTSRRIPSYSVARPPHRVAGSMDTPRLNQLESVWVPVKLF